MLGELGLLALILALLAATLQAGAGLWRSVTPLTLGLARRATHLQAAALLVSLGLLAAAFLQDDFSIAYVAHNSNTALPWAYKLAAVWGAHEGSLLLWATMLALWSLAVARGSASLPDEFASRVTGVLGAVAVGFLSFTLFTSNPFVRLLPAAAEGRDLNPLLQDPGLVMHPPMLYLGYVGFAVGFAFAVGALIVGKVDATWARWVRPWTTAAWCALTIGIALGSWWAYYELGWGGWWFWDPVENASFMPWLAGTALIHSLAVTEKRGAFVSWTLLLAILTFSLSLLGTFLVRSGVLVSVHAFATDPLRGTYILAFLVIVIGTALALYAWRAPQLPSGGGFQAWSRETFLLVNNLLLAVACAAVLLGTLYPLLLDALELGRISVGPPYFDAVFVPLMLPLLAAIGLGPVLRWRKDEVTRVLRLARWPALAGVLVVALVWAGHDFQLGWLAVCGVTLGAWALVGAWTEPVRIFRETRRVPRAVLGMALAHMGLGVTVLGITVVSALGVERDVRLAPGVSAELVGHTFTYQGVSQHPGPNYDATRVRIGVTLPDGDSFELEPEKRVYRAMGSPMTEAAIDPSLTRDLYVALGDPIGADAWAVRLQYKPLVRWIWLGAVLMALGGLLALADRRYRARLPEQGA
jgi:cytochrome c-type biogenesis protein CcmF